MVDDKEARVEEQAGRNDQLRRLVLGGALKSGDRRSDSSPDPPERKGVTHCNSPLPRTRASVTRTEERWNATQAGEA